MLPLLPEEDENFRPCIFMGLKKKIDTCCHTAGLVAQQVLLIVY